MGDRRHYVLATGGRKFTGREAVVEVFTFLKLLYGAGLRCVVGDAGGLDKLVREVCAELDIPFKEFKADWRPNGGPVDKLAGFKRNGRMVDLLAKWDRDPDISTQVLSWPGGNGTRDCSRKAEEAGLIVDYIAPTRTISTDSL